MTSHSQTLKRFPIFEGLTDDQLKSVSRFIKSRTLGHEEYLFKEGDPGESFFLIEKGAIEILKKDPSSEEEIGITTLREGDIVGEMASLGGLQRTTTARAVKAVHLLELSMEEISQVPELRPVYLHLKNKLPQIVTLRVINNNNALVAGYKKQLEHEKARSALGSFIVHLIVLVFLYIFAIKTIAVLNIQTVSSTIISIPVLCVFAAAMLRMIKQTGYPWKIYGFTLKGWKRSLIESFFFSIPVFGVVVAYKWASIQIDPSLHNVSLFHVSLGLNPDVKEGIHFMAAFFLVAGYAVFVPVQEMIYRGAMQNTLEQFLLGKHKTFLAIVISNLPFSLIHLHLSIMLTILVYFFGLFWGWLYARQRTLVGCTFSHFLIGMWAFFIVGISDILRF